MHYSMLIQGSPCNGSFQWINPYKFRNPFITSMTVLFRPNQVIFNNVDTTNMVTNTMTDTTFLIPLTIVNYYSRFYLSANQ